MGKVIFLDCETTGIDSQRCAIVQLAGIVEVAGEVQEEFSLMMRPWNGALIEQSALDVNCRKQEDLFSCELDALTGKKAFEKILGRYVDKFDRQDKFIISGYNVGFDVQFLRAWWERLEDKYFGSYFAWPLLDVASFLAEFLISTNGSQLRFENFKLGTVCKALGVEMGQAHDAMEDIRATRRLYRRLKNL